MGQRVGTGSIRWVNGLWRVPAPEQKPYRLGMIMGVSAWAVETNMKS